MFANKTAVITGAGSGFGKAFAKIGAKLGMKLVLVDSRLETLDSTADNLETNEVLRLQADVAVPEQVGNVATATRQRFGAPHFIFNNAGVATSGFVWEHTPEEWNWLLGVNIGGVVNGIRAFTPMMLAEAKRNPAYLGHIVNTASVGGLVNTPLAGMYNTSKNAVVGLTETLHHDLGLVTDQVTTSVLCPHFISTGIGSVASSQLPHNLSDLQTSTPSRLIGSATLSKAVASSRVSAEEMAEKVFDAIEKKKFYIFSHPEVTAAVEVRLKDIISGQPPRDPYFARPAIGQKLKNEIQKGYADFDFENGSK